MRSAPVESEWERLTVTAPPFLRPAFFLATARWLVTSGRPVYVTACRGRELGAMLPLVRRRGDLKALRSLHTPRFDLVGDPEVVPALWRVLREEVSWRSLELGGVPESSPLVTELLACARRDRYPVAIGPGSAAPFLPLHEFERGLDGRFRRNLMARRRKVPELLFERVSAADPEALADMFRIEAAAWKGDAGTAIAVDRTLVGFYTEIARRFAASGALTLAFLRSGDRRIAAHFALEDAHTYYLLKTGYDPEHARSAPGHLLLYECALDARRRGLREIDFLGQDTEWKRQWTQLVRRHVRLYAYRPSAVGHGRHALRHVVRPILGRWRLRLRTTRARLR